MLLHFTPTFRNPQHGGNNTVLTRAVVLQEAQFRAGFESVQVRHRPPQAMNKKEYEVKTREEFRDYMVRRIDQRKYDLEYFTGLYYNVLSYRKTLTVAKIILISGMDRKTFYEAKNGKYDDSLAMYLYKENIEETDAELVDGLPMHNGVILLPPSEIIEKLYLMMEDRITEEMLETKSMPQVTARIFLKKAVFGYSDQPQTVNQTNILQISDSQLDLADRLLK